MKRIRIITGHYGSGKSELSVNMVMELRKQFDKVAIVDLDMTTTVCPRPMGPTTSMNKKLKIFIIFSICIFIIFIAINFKVEKLIFPGKNKYEDS